MDDSLLMTKVTAMECRNIIMEVLDKYEQASRQKINRAKTSLFFSTNISEVTRREIQDILEIEANSSNAILGY